VKIWTKVKCHVFMVHGVHMAHLGQMYYFAPASNNIHNQLHMIFIYNSLEVVFITLALVCICTRIPVAKNCCCCNSFQIISPKCVGSWGSAPDHTRVTAMIPQTFQSPFSSSMSRTSDGMLTVSWHLYSFAITAWIIWWIWRAVSWQKYQIFCEI